MPNNIDATGLTVATTDEIATGIQAAFKAAYGTDINLDSNSPDGQMIGIFTQADTDVLDLLVGVYNMFDVDSSFGISLQRLVAVNGMTIKSGKFTTTPVNATTDRALTLPGLEQSLVAPFQVRDSNNLWTLVSSFAFGGAGTQALVFQCSVLGPVTPLPNTITNQATPTLGVTAVNNPTTAGTVLGQDEETDVDLRIRHAKSFQLAATSPADAVEAALQAIVDATDALVVENRTGGTVGGVAAHSIWAIVVGGTPVEIAAAIYAKAAPGVGLTGAQSLVVSRPNGQGATMQWDTGLAQRLWTQFGVISSVAGVTFDKPLLAQQLAAAMVRYFKLGRSASIGDIVRAMFKIEPRAILTGAGVSIDGVAYNDTVAPTSPKFYFTMAAADVTIS